MTSGPLVLVSRVLEQVVVVHERADAAGHQQRRQPVGHLIELMRLVHQAQPLVNEVAENRGDAAGEAEGIGAVLHAGSR